MNIVIVGPAYPLRGGIAHYNTLLASHLRKRHDVHVVTFKRQYPSILFPGTSQEEPGGKQMSPPAEVMIDSINPFNWLRVAAHLRKQNPHLIIFTYWMPFFGPCLGTIARFAKRGTNVKIMYLCHNIVPHERRPGDLGFTKFAFRPADYYIVQSDAVEKDLLKLNPHAVFRKTAHPVYGIFGEPVAKETARQELGISAKKVMLYFGYVRAYKGLMVLIEAMKKLVEHGWRAHDFQLLVVGEFYDNEQKYRLRVSELGLDSIVQFHSGYVPNDRVRIYFSAVDVVVLPYRSATQSGIIQIAYNFDKPVITTNVGGLAEVVPDGKTGFVVPPDDPESLASAIRRFYEENREPEFAMNVHREKEKYSWEKVVAAIEELMGNN